MKIKLLYLFLALLPAGFLWSQSIEDVRRLSQTTYLGSTRFLASGGAFTSLGNDFTAAHQNPAGFAVFRRSEFSLSMGALNSGTTSIYSGTNVNDNVGGFVFGNAGLVISLPEQSEWKWNIGASFNHSADYRNRVSSFGQNVQNSRINMWMDRANGTHPDDLLANGLVHEWMAYQAYLIDADTDNNYSTVAKTTDIDQIFTLDQSGGMNELALLFATEKDNRWYFGGSVNVPFMKFTRDVVYTESGLGDSIVKFGLKEHNEMKGSGINVKIGAQYRFDNGFRLGAAIHTPTWFNIEQSWEDEMNTTFANSGNLAEVVSVFSDPYTWKLTTPWRVLLGVSKVFGKHGFLSADYELNTYNTAKAKSDSININYLNDEINRYTQLSHVFRLGGELRLNKFYLRAGYMLETSGLTKEFESTNVNMVSFGAGYRGKNVSIEFAYAIRNLSQNYYFYNSEYASPARADISQKPLMFKLSYRFNTK